MNKTLLLLLLFHIFQTVDAQVPSNCNIPAVLRTYYEPDVKDMAVQWLYSIKSPDTALIEIPQWCQDTILSGLAAIFNRVDIPEVDSVFNKYCIHREWGIINLKEIAVYVDTTFAWTYNWFNLQTFTGIPALDSLLEKYGFVVTNAYTWTHPPMVTLETNQLINLFALCDSLGSFPGITYADPGSWGGAGTPNGIAFSDTGYIKYFTFTLGWDLAGWYYWNFKVNPDCSIEFLGNGPSWGHDPLPAPVNCNILETPPYTVLINEIKIYPNPVKDFLTISLQEQLCKGLVDILNLNGQVLLKFSISDSGTQIDISNLPAGIYMARLSDETGVKVGKIVKW